MVYYGEEEERGEKTVVDKRRIVCPPNVIRFELLITLSRGN